MLDDMNPLANSVCLLALSRSDWLVLALLRCAGPVVLAVLSVLAIDVRRQMHCS